jgi:PAS domain S-box-containing protein
MMFAFIKRLLAPPVFKDEEDNHKALLLHVILWGLILASVFFAAYILLFMPNYSRRALFQGGFGLVINTSLMILLRRGYVRTAAFIQVTALWMFYTVSAFTGIGVRGEAYLLGYPLVIVITGLLFGGHTALVTTFASLLAGLFMVYGESYGFIKVGVDRPALYLWIVSLAIFPIGAVLQHLSARFVKDALRRVNLSEEKHRLISGVSFDYTFESKVDEHGNGSLVSVAGAFEKMTGYSQEEYIASGGWLGHVYPDDLEKDAEDMRKLLNNQHVINSEIRTFTKNGEIRWERIFAHPVWSEEENRLIGIVGAVQDVTAQKQADEQLNETILRQNAILDNIPDMAWLKDLNSRYIAVNEQYSKLSGLKIKDIIGKTDHDIWENKFADAYRNDDLEVIQSGKRRKIEEIQRDSTGNEYWVETIKTPIRNAQGEVIGTTGIARQITERKKAQIERERLIAELEAKNAELERFTYTVSHDLKSPLVTITGFLSYLERDARAGDFNKFKIDLERIQQAVEKMQDLLKDLLELSRIGRLMNEPVEISFSEIVREALSLADGQAKAGGVSVEFADDGHKIRGDRIRLVEVMQNLVDNAIKFMGDQPNPRIRIGTITDPQNIPTFFVQDNGIGIDPQYHKRIFGLFNKLDSSSHGSGVGLSIVKRIIEVHGGNIWVESQPGKGSTFYFNFS